MRSIPKRISNASMTASSVAARAIGQSSMPLRRSAKIRWKERPESANGGKITSGPTSSIKSCPRNTRSPPKAMKSGAQNQLASAGGHGRGHPVGSPVCFRNTDVGSQENYAFQHPDRKTLFERVAELKGISDGGDRVVIGAGISPPEKPSGLPGSSTA